MELNKVINDPHLQRSFIRSLEVIGEATKNLSKDLKNNHPEIEWRKIIWSYYDLAIPGKKYFKLQLQ